MGTAPLPRRRARTSRGAHRVAPHVRALSEARLDRLGSMGRRRDRASGVVRAGVGCVMQPEVLWQPPSDIRRRARIGQYLEHLENRHGLRFVTYADLWEW